MKLGEAAEAIDLRLLAENREAYFASEFAIFDDERVGVMFVEAKFGGDARGKGGKSAGDKGGIGLVGFHCGKESFAALHESDPCTEQLVDDTFIQILEKADALFQCGFEIEFAAHGLFRDFGDALADACNNAKLVDAFLVDHGRIHVGDEQAFAAVVDRYGCDIHRELAQLNHGFVKAWKSFHFQGFAGCKPVERRSARFTDEADEFLRYCAGAGRCYENEDGIHIAFLMRESVQKSVVLIAGPTASGKSALALRLARDRGGAIINADSMQVYRELRVVTARPSREDEAAVPHLLYGHVSGLQDYSTGQWLTDARAAIATCFDEGLLPIITGGTGLYFKALEEGLAEVPAIPADIKTYWRLAEGDLHARLVKRDPAMAARLNPSDLQRIRRALEVHDATAKSLLWWQEKGASEAALKDCVVERIHVSVPREELHARAALRFDQMLKLGAIEEVRSLPVMDPKRPIMKAIGVPEIQAHLAGVMSLDEAREKAVIATRQYIKRQDTWWRGQMKGWATS